jgi:6-phosphogluconolactonase
MADDVVDGASKDQPPGPAIVIADDPDAVAGEGTRRVRDALARAVAARGAFKLALAGGSTPRKLYARVADDAQAGAVDWSRVQLFFGDERCVPPSHPDSNFGMVKAILLDRIEIPAANVHRLRGEETDLASAAAAYARSLPRPLDLALLGIGSDGHTASLFPRSAVLDDPLAVCAVVEAPSLETRRLTLTLPIFLETREIIFLVTGAEKAEILREIVCGPWRPRDLPAQAVARRTGPVTIVCDGAAAARLPAPPGPARWPAR